MGPRIANNGEASQGFPLSALPFFTCPQDLMKNYGTDVGELGKLHRSGRGEKIEIEWST